LHLSFPDIFFYFTFWSKRHHSSPSLPCTRPSKDVSSKHNRQDFVRHQPSRLFIELAALLMAFVRVKLVMKKTSSHFKNTQYVQWNGSVLERVGQKGPGPSDCVTPSQGQMPSETKPALCGRASAQRGGNRLRRHHKSLQIRRESYSAAWMLRQETASPTRKRRKAPDSNPGMMP